MDPLQLSSNSFDIHKPIAPQLAQVIEQLHLNDQGSDSGAISDYESSVCSVAESIKSTDFDLGPLDKMCTSEYNIQDEETSQMTITPGPYIEGLNDNYSQIRPSKVKEKGKDHLCSLEINDQSDGSFWPETLWHFKTDMNSRSAQCLPSMDIKGKPIQVAELEKYFFTTNSDGTSQAMEKLGANEEPSNMMLGPAYCVRPHWKSQLHFRNEDNWETILVSPKSRRTEISCIPQIRNSSLEKNHIQESNTKNCDQSLNCQISQECAKKVKKIEEKRSISNEEMSRTEKERSFLYRKRQHEPQHKEKEQSPLTLCSQNIRKSYKKDSIRSFRSQNRNRHHFKHKGKDKEFEQCELDQDKEFNHHEVVQFLLEGMHIHLSVYNSYA